MKFLEKKKIVETETNDSVELSDIVKDMIENQPKSSEEDVLEVPIRERSHKWDLVERVFVRSSIILTWQCKLCKLKLLSHDGHSPPEYEDRIKSCSLN